MRIFEQGRKQSVTCEPAALWDALESCGFVQGRFCTRTAEQDRAMHDLVAMLEDDATELSNEIHDSYSGDL